MKRGLFAVLLALCMVLPAMPVHAMLKTGNAEAALPEDATDGQREVAYQITDPDDGAAAFDAVLPELLEAAQSERDNADGAELINILNEVLEDDEKVEFSDEITIHVLPYIHVKVTDVKTLEDSNEPEVTLDIEMLYDVVISTVENVDDIVTEKDKTEGAADPINAVVIKEKQHLCIQPGTSVEITLPLPRMFRDLTDVLVVEHTKDDGTIYYYDIIVNDDSTITFSTSNGFSQFVIKIDDRKVVIDYKKSETEVEQTVYTPLDVSVAELPTATKAGFIHVGWEFAGLAGIYSGKLTNPLLTDLSNVSDDETFVIEATPVFIGEEDSSDENPSEKAETEEEIEPDLEELEGVFVEAALAKTTPPATDDGAAAIGYTIAMAVSGIGIAAIVVVKNKY